jgi:hypothetical protein
LQYIGDGILPESCKKSAITLLKVGKPLGIVKLGGGRLNDKRPGLGALGAEPRSSSEATLRRGLGQQGPDGRLGFLVPPLADVAVAEANLLINQIQGWQ